MFQRTTQCGPDATSQGSHRHGLDDIILRRQRLAQGFRAAADGSIGILKGRRRPPRLNRRAAPQGPVERWQASWPGLLPPHGSTTGFSLAISSRFCCHDSTQDRVQRLGLCVAQVTSELLRDGSLEHRPRPAPLVPTPIRQDHVRSSPVAARASPGATTPPSPAGSPTGSRHSG